MPKGEHRIPTSSITADDITEAFVGFRRNRESSPSARRRQRERINEFGQLNAKSLGQLGAAIKKTD